MLFWWVDFKDFLSQKREEFILRVLKNPKLSEKMIIWFYSKNVRKEKNKVYFSLLLFNLFFS